MAAASRRTSPTPRRVLAIKRADGEPLTRVDLQYDLLHHIFSSEEKAFTSPWATSTPSSDQPNSSSTKTTFRELYIDAILNSPKSTKALKDKMKESPAFALDFAMLSLLVNVGRVNTTMSFFPEMKTAIRSYHPLPSLQRTNGNMQDAPRIKHLLKFSLLEQEKASPPATPTDILARCKAGQPPSTSVTNLLFVLSSHTGPVGVSHFQGTYDFLDIFLRTDISSASRAQTFLWLCFHYLEAPTVEDDYDDDTPPNPFGNAGPPGLVYLTEDEVNAENQETEEDRAILEKLAAQRSKFVATVAAKTAEHNASTAGGKGSANGSVKGDDDDATPGEETPKNGKSVSAKRAAPGTGLSAKERRQAAKERKAAAAAAAVAAATPVASPVPKETPKGTKKARTFMAHLPDLDDESDDEFDMYMSSRIPHTTLLNATLNYRRAAKPYLSGLNQPSTPTNGSRNHPHLRKLASSETTNGSAHARRFSPYPATRFLAKGEQQHRHERLTAFISPDFPTPNNARTYVSEAWHVISSTDPLVDSDDEGDEYVREDYVQRLRVLDRLAPPIPPTNDDSPQSVDMDVDL